MKEFNLKKDREQHLKVEIKGKEYEIEKEVFDLIYSISLERDELKEKLYKNERKHRIRKM